MTSRDLDVLYIYDYDGQGGSNDKNFIGGVDETVVFKKVLKQGDIDKIYNSGGSYNYDKKNAPSGLVAWWRFGDERDFQGDIYSNADDNSGVHAVHGGTVHDRSGSKFHLEVENSSNFNIFQFTPIILETFPFLSGPNFDVKKIRYIEVVSAIVFPSASALVGV